MLAAATRPGLSRFAQFRKNWVRLEVAPLVVSVMFACSMGFFFMRHALSNPDIDLKTTALRVEGDKYKLFGANMDTAKDWYKR